MANIEQQSYFSFQLNWFKKMSEILYENYFIIFFLKIHFYIILISTSILLEESANLSKVKCRLIENVVIMLCHNQSNNSLSSYKVKHLLTLKKMIVLYIFCFRENILFENIVVDPIND